MSQKPSSLTWSTRDTVVVAISAVVFGVLYLTWVQLWLFVQGIIGPLAMDIVFGFWFAGSTFTAYIVRKPWVALTTAMIAVVTQILLGNAAGAILLLTGLIQGLGSEVPLAATRWRRYSLPILLASGASAALFSFVYNWIRFDYGSLALGLVAAMFLIRVASGMLLGGLLPKFVADRLRSTGIFDGLAIEMQNEEPSAV